MGSLDSAEETCCEIAVSTNRLVVAPAYRLAPEHPYPSGLEDCYTAALHVFAQAETLGVNPASIAIGGSSAGGGLAAGTALLLRDRTTFGFAAQILMYPMLDHRNRSTRDTHPSVWNRKTNQIAWDATSTVGE